MNIYFRHVKSIPGRNGRGYCAKGVRQFAKRYGFDYLDFCRNGIDVDKLEPFKNDVMVQAVIKEAEKEYGKV